METYFDDDYTGPRFHYGMNNRPLSIGAQPKGFIVGSWRKPQAEKAMFRWGVIAYPRPLTEKEIYDFELTPFDGEE